MPRSGADFFPRIPSDARILVLDLGFLGDTIHLIPPLAAIRRALPAARLEVMVSEHVKKILAVCPWINAVHGYPRFPKGPRWYEDVGRVQALRAEKFAAVINLNGSDRSSILTRLTGAPLRLGRVPPKYKWFWPYCFTHTVNVPQETQPIFRQSLDALKMAGFPQTKEGALFPLEIPAAAVEAVSAKVGSPSAFVHVSPFTTQDEKELPIAVLAEFLNATQAARPDLAWVLSTAPNARETGKLAQLRTQLNFKPWRVFAGELDLIELLEVMRRSQLHLGGDSGALHVALMADRRTLSWWRDYSGRIDWAPQGQGHAVVVGQASPTGLTGITARNLLEQFNQLLPR